MQGNGSDWQTKLLSDKNFTQETPYDYKTLLSCFEEVNKDLEHIRPYEFLRGIYEFTKGFKKLSSSLSLAFSDITDKVGLWRQLFTNYDPYKFTDIQSVMEKEIELNIHELNGDNNSKKGYKKGSVYHKYESGTRTTVRLTWFLNFMALTFKDLADKDASFKDIIKNSYDVVLAPHHGWTVRSGAKVAFSFAPKKKEEPLKILFGN